MWVPAGHDILKNYQRICKAHAKVLQNLTVLQARVGGGAEGEYGVCSQLQGRLRAGRANRRISTPGCAPGEPFAATQAGHICELHLLPLSDVRSFVQSSRYASMCMYEAR